MSKPPKPPKPPAKPRKEVTGVTYTKDFGNPFSEEMPSVSRLLNRKMLGVTKTYDPAKDARKQEPPKAPKPKSVEFQIERNERPSPPPAQAQSKIQPFNRKKQIGPTPALAAWEKTQLQATSDPMAKGLLMLLDRGANAALFLAASGPSIFAASAALGADKRSRIWKGLNWEPSVVPEVWSYFEQTGFVELSPPGTMTNVGSHRNVVREAFGVDKGEWLTLVRVGTASSCRGVLALVSTRSILLALPEAMRHFSAAPPSKAA